MMGYYEDVLRDSGIKVKWAGELRIGIQQGDKAVSRKVQDYDLPVLFPNEVDKDLRKQVLEYATVISCKAIRFKEYVEDYIDRNWIKTLLRLDGEMLEEYICELAVGKRSSVFCKCGRDAFILQSGQVVQLYWLELTLERINAVKTLCKCKQFPINLKKILSEAINIARMEIVEYTSIEVFEDKVEVDAKEAEELAKCDIPF